MMNNRRPYKFNLSNGVPDLFDFSLPCLQRRSQQCLRFKRSKYLKLVNRLSSQRLLYHNDNVQQTVTSTPESSSPEPSTSNSQYDDDDCSTDNASVVDSLSDWESDDSPVTFEPDEDESYVWDCDIKINVDDIGVDVDSDKSEISINYVYDSNDRLQLAKTPGESSESNQISLPRIYVQKDYAPTRRLSAQDKQLANKLIKHARYNKMPIMEDLMCPDCKLVPRDPVTGICGHTRCMKCITINGICPCGTSQPDVPYVNILVRDIIEKMIKHYNLFDGVLIRELPYASNITLQRGRSNEGNLPLVPVSSSSVVPEPTRYFTVTLEAQLALAQRLMMFGYHFGAIPHLAHVAAAQGSKYKHVRSLLTECVSVVNETERDRRHVRRMYSSVRNLSAMTWLRKSEIECILCLDFYKDPVTTYCGHTYCRNCLLRSINYSHTCPLCKRSLVGLDVYEITETFFVTSILYSMDSDKGVTTLEPDVVPIFMCTVALPNVPCPLLILDVRYWRSLKRLLGSGKREFGMIARHRDNAIPEYGTILEIRDCVQLQNGGSLLSTVGKWRFKITEVDFVHGCDVAKIERLSDKIPQDPAKIHYLRSLAACVAIKANIWLSKIDARAHTEIESVYGGMPIMGRDDTDWWESDDGPNWLWWLISILPLKSPIKILILSAQCVIKRLIAVDLTLNTINMIYKKNSAKGKKRPFSNSKRATRKRVRRNQRED